MNCRSPAPAARLFRGEPGEVEPTLVEKIAETVWTSGPGKHRNRIDDRAQITLTRQDGILCALPIVDIRHQAAPAGNSIGCISHGKKTSLEPSINAIRPAATVLNVVGSSGCDRMRKGGGNPGKVIWMNRVAGRPALQFLRRFAKVFQ